MSLIHSDAGSSTKIAKNQEGTAIALVIPCPEVANLYIRRKYSDNIPNYESNEDSYQSLVPKSEDNLGTDSFKFAGEDSQREPFCE